MSKIQQNNCVYCKKTYKKKENLEKHIGLCEFLYTKWFLGARKCIHRHSNWHEPSLGDEVVYPFTLISNEKSTVFVEF